MAVRWDAGELCNRIVVFATRDMTVAQAARLMREHHVGCLVVADPGPEGPRVVGMLTDRDIVAAVVAMSLDASVLRVEDVMSADIVCARSDDSIAELLETLRREGLRRLPVTSPDGVLIGLVTIDDLLPVMAEQLKLLATTIEVEQRRERRRRP